MSAAVAATLVAAHVEEECGLQGVEVREHEQWESEGEQIAPNFSKAGEGACSVRVAARKAGDRSELRFRAKG